jgi:hypothetical protein
MRVCQNLLDRSAAVKKPLGFSAARRHSGASVFVITIPQPLRVGGRPSCAVRQDKADTAGLARPHDWPVLIIARPQLCVFVRPSGAHRDEVGSSPDNSRRGRPRTAKPSGRWAAPQVSTPARCATRAATEFFPGPAIRRRRFLAKLSSLYRAISFSSQHAQFLLRIFNFGNP